MARRRPKVDGMRKFVCQDCEATSFWKPHDVYSGRKTGRAHCTSCGSTFLEPSDGSLMNKERKETIRQIDAMKDRYGRRAADRDGNPE